MRRMIKDKQINYIDELEKYLTINQYGININSNVTLGEYLLFGQISEDTKFMIGLEDNKWTIGTSDDPSYVDTCGIILGQDQGIDFYASEQGKLVTIKANPDGEPGIYGNNTLEISPDNQQNVGIYMENTNNSITLYGEVIMDHLVITDLPTSDPQVEGALWNDNGVLKISAGE